MENEGVIWIALRYHAGDKVRTRAWTEAQKPRAYALSRGWFFEWTPLGEIPDGREGPIWNTCLFVPYSRVIQVRYSRMADVLAEVTWEQNPSDPR